MFNTHLSQSVRITYRKHACMQNPSTPYIAIQLNVFVLLETRAGVFYQKQFANNLSGSKNDLFYTHLFSLFADEQSKKIETPSRLLFPLCCAHEVLMIYEFKISIHKDTLEYILLTFCAIKISTKWYLQTSK